MGIVINHPYGFISTGFCATCLDPYFLVVAKSRVGLQSVLHSPDGSTIQLGIPN